jgi:hypothetical protein
MGRGRDHWWHSGGAVLLNQIEGLDSRWGDYLLKLNPPSGGPAPARKPGKKA